MAYFKVHLDYERSRSAGAEGMFQVISITDENEKDHTHLVDQGTHYPNLASLASDIAEALGITAKEVDLDEV
jgi:type I restriction enzyme S subunit